MWTDATGLPSEGAAAVSQTLDATAGAASATEARMVRSLDDRLTVNELCGIRQGYMKTGPYALSRPAFAAWEKHQYAYEKSVGLLTYLPPYCTIDYPSSNSNLPSAPQDQSL